MSHSSPRDRTVHTGEGETTSHSPHCSRRSRHRLEVPTDQSNHVASCPPVVISPIRRLRPGWQAPRWAHGRGGGLRDQIHEEGCTKGHNTDVGAFTQHYGSDQRDAGLPMIRLAGFLPATDDRVRYGAGTAEHVDGLQERDCAFWPAHLVGRLPAPHGPRRGRASATGTTGRAEK
jgi:hypothetical protein